jgi:hypothetical protein
MVVAIEQDCGQEPGGQIVRRVAAMSNHARFAALRPFQVALFALLLLVPLSQAAAAAEGPAEEAKANSVADAAEIDFRKAVALYRKRDYRTSFKDFDRLARGGHPGAWYYLGVMNGLGHGTRVDWERAYTWLSCAAHGARDRGLQIDASQQRALVRRKLSLAAVRRAQRAAQQACQVEAVAIQDDSAERPLFNPVRSTFVDQLMFSAGDMIVMSVVFVAQRFDLTMVKNMAMAAYKVFGDWFIGLLSVLWWLMFGKMAYLYLAATGGQHGSRQSGTVNIMSPRHKGGRDNKFSA